MIAHPGYDTLVTHLFVDDDPYLDSDAVFGVKQSLIVSLTDESGQAPGKDIKGGWKSLDRTFGLKPKEARQ
jgi:hydroxyquinol 1,2-dioxygenase